MAQEHDQWTLDNETLQEVLRKIFTFDGFTQDRLLDKGAKIRARESALYLKAGLLERMLKENVTEVRTGSYVAELSTEFGVSLSLRVEQKEVGL